MHQRREDLEILFHRTMPETILKKIRSGNSLRTSPSAFKVGFAEYTYEAYDHYSLLNLSEYSGTEVGMRKEALDASITENGTGGIFSVLAMYADKVLHYNGDELTCHSEKILNWHSIYWRLGQDIFTTAWLAWLNHLECPDKMKGSKMAWPAILKTDDGRLNSILMKGVAENHFHLHGSTQSFALSWACLMNHPTRIFQLLNKNTQFKLNLNYNVSSGVDDNVMDWETRILYAAMIRALLFECCIGLHSEENESKELRNAFRKFDYWAHASDVRKHTEMLRYVYGRKFEQIDKREVCLDYANCDGLYRVDENEDNRLLAGERCFLYQCFRRQFRGKASQIESDLFYLYLLIKSNFRSELIQTNKRYGFQNFADYQGRKNQLFGKYDEYWTESFRLSICSGAKENNICSLEARIMPEISSLKMYQVIKDLDNRVKFSGGKDISYFYVTHFAKTPLKNSEFGQKKLVLQPRNYTTRSRIKKQAKALDRYMHNCDYNNQRVWGIDACSMEIGCRPETFATEMRYLRARSRDKMESKWYRIKEYAHKEIGITYHVGEDFLDIADGLRATDEAISFLGMEKGDRIGHGLVLGIEPEEYYRIKRYRIYLRKQDYLDNLVWILFRSLELGVEIKENNRANMVDQATKLLYEIFERFICTLESGNPLELYYRSWQLRGDHPELYKMGKFGMSKIVSEKSYDNYRVPGGLVRYNTRYDKLRPYRENRDITAIYSWYHFDNGVKSRGYQVTEFPVEKWYIDVMKELQHAMRKEIFNKGICIECNPTSNVLIGTFKSYIKHPILNFNKFHLEEDSKHMNIQVSLNTDDLGVFDTSLANEYALMLNAICRSRHEAGNYNDDAVYEYLDYLRMNGINMAFKKKQGNC